MSTDPETSAPHTPGRDVDAFIAYWSDASGSEGGNAQSFVIDLCHLLNVEPPRPQQEDNARNTYVFERSVYFKLPDGTRTPGRIDCYKRDCFILEAKQSAKRKRQARADGGSGLFPPEEPAAKTGHAKRGTRTWDTVMRQARQQAADYARALPVEHGYPPFLLVVDIAHVIEVFADFSGQGKNYAHFPDKQSFRVQLEDLRDPGVRQRLATIWTDPQSLDPTRRAAEVTRDVADRLANIAKRLEKDDYAPREVATFLMRCLFTMFAEDVGLLPKDCFAELLKQQKETPQTFPRALEQFWGIMDKGGYALHLNATIKRFNGTLFKDTTALPLDAEGIHELWVAATRDWSDVEPSIFGTLLEHALDKRERSQLGAHYTPRAYVERLVIPTIIDPLRTDWQQVQAAVEDLRAKGDNDAARQRLRDFLHQLATTRVLDPACGTGNFLYVALELMKRLEGEVTAALEEMGENAPRLAIKGETVSPQQFLGLELNPRAVEIADLVLWIGYLKWQLKTGGPDSIKEPVLDRYGTIREQDAVITWDKPRELRTDERGKPITVWDGRTYKPHPVTGEQVPDETARLETYRYTNPRPAPWPTAEFVVGNPPFIGGKDLRDELGDGYAEAIWAARKHMPGGADFVMHFWDQAATLLRAKGTKLRRFGFITTNSITQTFSRRVIERHMQDKTPLSLVFAVPDHPWLKQADKAAVRIAMTVAVQGKREGVLARSVHETGLNTDTPTVELDKRTGNVLANFTLGADISLAQPLLANEALASRGVVLHGSGFIVTQQQAKKLGLGTNPDAARHILPYRNGRDLAQRPREVMVVDLFTLEENEVRDRLPEVYQHVRNYVKPERDENRRSYRRENWWLFGENIPKAREMLFSIDRYIATVETCKHRFFQFLDASVRPDNKLVNIGLQDAAALGVLSSRLHVRWMLATGGKLGVGNDPVYVKTRCFDPFPFPLLDTLDARTCAQLRDLGERLDQHRKQRIERHGHLTMTALYNVLERVRELAAGADVAPLSDSERDVYDAGLVGVLGELHDEIDTAVLRAYGWDDLIDPLVGKPGATCPSPHKTAEQEAAEQTLLCRLVALNQTRRAEEQQGTVRWLRPDYQLPKLRHKLPQGTQLETPGLEPVTAERQPKWPSDDLQQIRVVHQVLERADSPVTPDTVARAFAGKLSPKRKQRVDEVLQTLTATGAARTPEDDPNSYFVPR